MEKQDTLGRFQFHEGFPGEKTAGNAVDFMAFVGRNLPGSCDILIGGFQGQDGSVNGRRS